MLKRRFIISTLLSLAVISPLLAAPLVMHLATNALPIVLQKLVVNEATPLIFQPVLYSSSNFTRTQLPMESDQGRAVFSIQGSPNTSLRAQLTPIPSFPLDGNTITDTHYPSVTSFSLGGSGPVDSDGNFTTDSQGNFTLYLGGSVTGYGSASQAPTLPGAYVSNGLRLTISNNTAPTQPAVSIAYQIYLNVLENGDIKTVRSLVFSPQYTLPNVNYLQTVLADFNDPRSAELTYTPVNATLTIASPSICLTKNGASPTTSCPCPATGSDIIQVNSFSIVTSCNTQTCRAVIGAHACYPANLPSGLYQGTGTVTMTYD